MANETSKKRILVTGARGFLGKIVTRKLTGHSQYDVIATNSKEHDLTNLQVCVELTKNVDVVIHLAGLVLSRVEQKKRPADVLFVNTMSSLTIAEAAKINKVKKLIFTGSVTAYPADTPHPFIEESLWDGPVVDGSYAYGTSKRLLETIARAYREECNLDSVVLILPNLFGPGDKYSYTPPPLIPSIIQQIYSAKKGSQDKIIGGNNGSVTLDLLYVEDAAQAIVEAIEATDLPSVINVGTEEAVSIKDIYDTTARILGYEGVIQWEPGENTIPRLMNSEKAHQLLRWHNRTSFETGLKDTIDDFLKSVSLNK